MKSILILKEQDAYEGEIVWTIPELVELELHKDLPSSSGTNSEASVSATSTVQGSKSGIQIKRKPGTELPPSVLRLTTEVRNMMDEFHFTCNAELDELLATADLKDVRFTAGERNDFIAIRDKNRGKCLVYINPSGWYIVVELADVRAE